MTGRAEKQVLIIGGGAAGLAAANELSGRGVRSILAESSGNLGGLAKQLACKGAPQCQRCDACYPHDLRREVSSSNLVRVLTDRAVLEIEKEDGGFAARMGSETGMESVMADALILATGALPYDPDLDPRLRHGLCPDVLSSLEVEIALSATDRLVVPSTGKPPKEMAVVQCVGSRDVSRGMPYCSKACCKYAFKLARHLRNADPELRITFFYMDWRPLEDRKDALEGWAAVDDKVRIIRSRPSEILEGGRPIVRYAAPGDSVAEEAFDLVMLSVGMVPNPDNGRLARAVGLEVDELGFIASEVEGVFVAGTCRGPKDIRESVEEGVAAAGRAAGFLEAGR